MFELELGLYETVVTKIGTIGIRNTSVSYKNIVAAVKEIPLFIKFI